MEKRHHQEQKHTAPQMMHSIKKVAHTLLVVLCIYAGYKGHEVKVEQLLKQPFPTELTIQPAQQEKIDAGIEEIATTGKSDYIKSLLPDTETYQSIQAIVQTETKGENNTAIDLHQIKKMLSFHLQVGNPAISVNPTHDQWRPQLYKGRAYYNMFKKLIYLPDSSLAQRKAELAHAYQFQTRTIGDNFSHAYYTAGKTLEQTAKNLWADPTILATDSPLELLDDALYDGLGTIEHEAHKLIEPQISLLTGAFDFNNTKRRDAYLHQSEDGEEMPEHQRISQLMTTREQQKHPSVNYSDYIQFISDKLATYEPQQYDQLTRGSNAKNIELDYLLLERFYPYLLTMDPSHPFKQRVSNKLVSYRYITQNTPPQAELDGDCSSLHAHLYKAGRLHAILTPNSTPAKQLQTWRAKELIPALHQAFTEKGDFFLGGRTVTSTPDTPIDWETFYTKLCTQVFTRSDQEIFLGLLEGSVHSVQE